MSNADGDTAPLWLIKLGDINSYFTFKFYVPSNATNRSCFLKSINTVEGISPQCNNVRP